MPSFFPNFYIQWRLRYVSPRMPTEWLNDNAKRQMIFNFEAVQSQVGKQKTCLRDDLLHFGKLR
jgi:hypothetical protein